VAEGAIEEAQAQAGAAASSAREAHAMIGDVVLSLGIALRRLRDGGAAAMVASAGRHHRTDKDKGSSNLAPGFSASLLDDSQASWIRGDLATAVGQLLCEARRVSLRVRMAIASGELVLPPSGGKGGNRGRGRGSG